MSLVTTLKELYYELHQGDDKITEDNGGSDKFVKAMYLVLDGNSDLAREPNPMLSAFNIDHAGALRWRTMLFGDNLAWYCLRANVGTFYK